MKTEKFLFQITQEEMVEGYTIASALNFKLLGISASIARPGKEFYGPVRDLSALGDMVISILGDNTWIFYHLDTLISYHLEEEI